MKCPVCRAENGDENVCRRCKADLAMCQAVLRRREGLFAQTAAAVARGDGDDAFLHASRADRLKADAESARWLAIVALFRRDFSTAWANYQRWKRANG